jgi:hypothetical protein
MSRLLTLVIVGGLAAVPASGASPDPKDLVIPPQELSRARELVRRLGSEVYRDREEAHAELTKMGRLARPALLEGATSDPDPEVRYRCARLLPRAGADDLKARLDTFLADAEGKYEHDLPGLKQFRKLVGADKASRDLFVELVQSPYNVELLQALDRGPVEAGRAVADRRAVLYSAMQQRNVGGVIKPAQPVALADVACLLFAEAITPAKDIPRSGQFAFVSGVTFVTQNASVQAINNAASTPHAEPYKKIVAHWLETREDANEFNNNMAYVAGQVLRGFKESVPVLRKIVTTEGVYGYNKGQALMYLVQQRPKEELGKESGFLKSLLTNDTLVTTVWFGGNVPNANPIQHQCLLKDVALAMLVTHTGQKMADYGYVFPPGVILNPQNIGYGNYAFETEEKRAAAMVKFGFWQLKGSPAPKPGGGATPRKDEQPQPKAPPPGIIKR